MKNYKLYYFMFFVSIALMSCTKNFDKINTNPAKLTQIGPTEFGFMFSRAESAATIHRPYYQTIEINMPDLYAQYLALTTTSFTTDRYAFNDTWLSRPGIITYVLVMPQLQAILDNTDPASAQHALANIMKAYTFQRLTDEYGPVPYFNAGSTASSIPYDSQEAIYGDLFKVLDSAVTSLKAGDTTVSVFGNQDIIYNGNIPNWIRFANTLRLRMALRISNVDPDMAKQQAEAAVLSGVLTSNTQNATIQRSLSGDDANGLSFNGADNESSMSSTMASYLKGYNDLRLGVYFQPALATGQFKGLRNGSSATEINSPGNRPQKTSNIGAGWVTWNGSSWVPNLARRSEVMASAEAYFLLAEGTLNGWNMGGGSAREYYEEGIVLSMQQWGITDNGIIQQYINSNATPVAPGDEANSPAVSDIPIMWGATESVQRAQIGTQKWLAVFPDGIEAWSGFRRTGYPLMYPLLESDNADLPIGTFIQRLPYSSVDAATNGAALLGGIQLLGGPNTGATPVWWAK